MYKSVFVNDIHNQLMTSVNPEISCIRMGSGPALFGLARFYSIDALSYMWMVCVERKLLCVYVLDLYSCQQILILHSLYTACKLYSHIAHLDTSNTSVAGWASFCEYLRDYNPWNPPPRFGPAFQVSKTIGITREQSFILQIHEYESKKTWLDAYRLRMCTEA